MKTFKYQDREKHRQEWCDGCGGRFPENMLAPHHIYLRRYGDECIWLCDDCHKRVDQDRAWAYEQGLLRHHNVKDSRMTKREKRKKCNHLVSYYDPAVGGYVCQFCRAVIGELRTGKKQRSNITP